MQQLRCKLGVPPIKLLKEKAQDDSRVPAPEKRERQKRLKMCLFIISIKLTEAGRLAVVAPIPCFVESWEEITGRLAIDSRVSSGQGGQDR